MKILKYLSYMVMVAMATGVTSCLDEGEETFSLQGGDFDELLYGSWRVESCKLYDVNRGTYESDFINDSHLDYVYSLGESGGVVYDADGEPTDMVWSANEDEHSIALDGSDYAIESLGHQLMVISHDGLVNGETHLIKYYLRNIGPADWTPGNDNGNDDPDVDNGDEDETVVVSTSGSSTFNRGGYGFTIPKGSVPKGDDGRDGSVAFSVQSLPVSELPASAPDGVEFIDGTGILANPSNFTFASPLFMDVPLKGNSPENTCLYHWNPMTMTWEVVPYSSIKPGGTASSTTIDLGYFVVGIRRAGVSLGGIKVQKSQIAEGYYYYLTIRPESGSGSTSMSFTSGGEDLYMANLPVGGVYNVQISRERRSSLSAESTVVETSTVTQTVKISTALVAHGASYSDYSGWTVLNLSNINWNQGRPSYWGEETVTYGTGAFQSTLNWINYSGSTTDYDLHLTTPNGKEVYYSNRQADGFELDRDVISDLGNCVENIYSISETLPAGTYKVRVHHYSGATGRQYNCRVIVNGKVISTFSGVTNSGYQDICTFTLQ